MTTSLRRVFIYVPEDRGLPDGMYDDALSGKRPHSGRSGL